MKTKKIILSILHSLIAIIFTIIIFFPIYWMIITSFKSSSELMFENPSLIVQNFSIDSYIKVLQNTNFLKYLVNTIIATLGITLLQTGTSVLAAYGLAVGKFKHKKFVFAMIIGAMMIPQQITFIPLYITFSKMGLVNTFLGLILPEIVSPFLIYWLFNAFLKVDNSLVETGKIDGLNSFQLLWNVYIPFNMPVFVTTVLMSFINGWNSYFWPKIITNNDSHRVLTIGISYLKNTFAGDIVYNYNEIMAGVLLSILPIIIIFILFQKYITGENKI